MLRLSSLSVSNFRSLQSQPMTFPELAILVGKNDVGKSNVLAAIQLLLEGGSISPVDFYDLAKPIIVEATLEGATPDLHLREHGYAFSILILESALTFVLYSSPTLIFALVATVL